MLFDARPRTYILDKDDKPVAVSRKEFVRWIERADRMVAQTQVVRIVVCTVFTGLDMGFGLSKAPLVYETSVYGPEGDWRDPLTHRYATRAAAQRGHTEMVAMLVAEQQNGAAGAFVPDRVRNRVMAWSRMRGSA